MTSLRRSLVDALADGRSDDAAQVLGALEDEANAALAAGELATIASTRGRTSRRRRATAAADPHWEGVQRMLVLDRALGSAVAGVQPPARPRAPAPPPPHRPPT